MSADKTLAEAQSIVWDAFAPGPVVRRRVHAAMGLVLAQDVLTDIAFPPYDRVAMDGYAVKATDTIGATADSPVVLTVVGASVAGAPFDGQVQPGTAAKVMTGSVLPPGADAVVKVEDTGGYSNESASIHSTVVAGQHIAATGEDLAAGSIVVPAGTHLGVQHVHALLSAGADHVQVYAPPSVTVFATGDELVSPASVPGPGQIRESNSGAAAAWLASLGIDAVVQPAVVDDPIVMRSAFERALRDFDVVILSGGVSMGEKDHVKPVLRELGVDLVFESLQLRPGHPTTFGVHDRGWVFALPGNPVAVVATLVAVFAPGIRRRMGHLTAMPAARYVELGFDARRRGSRPQLLPVSLESAPRPGLSRAFDTRHHGSGDFVSLARAQGFAWLDGAEATFPAGTVVRFYPVADS